MWGDGSPEREFIFSDDLAEAIYLILRTNKKKLYNLCNNNFPIINIGSGYIYSIKKLAELLKIKIGFKGKIIFDHKFPNGVMKKNLNFNRIQKLGWSPKTNLNLGLDIVLKDLSY